MTNTGKNYGMELILDLHECNPETFTREKIGQYFVELCDLIDMTRADLHWWDDLDLPEEEHDTEPHLKGTSAIQFITTSNITIHTLDMMKCVYINLFSCKTFDPEVAKKFSRKYYEGEIKSAHFIDRV